MRHPGVKWTEADRALMRLHVRIGDAEPAEDGAAREGGWGVVPSRLG